VDGVGAGSAGGGEHAVDVEVGLGRGTTAEGDRVVGLDDERGTGVGLGVDRHGVDPHRRGGAHHPAGDLPPVGDEQGRDRSSHRSGAHLHIR